MAVRLHSPYGAILLWRFRGGEDVSEVRKSSSLEMARKTEPENNSSHVIDSLSDWVDRDNEATLYMYFDFQAHKEQSTASVLAALLNQLVAEVKPMSGRRKEVFKRAKRVVGGRTLRLRKICGMLIESLSSLRRVFICIDALDEFPTEHRPELWGSLQDIVQNCPNTRLFITGRPHLEEEMGKYFLGYPYLIPINPPEKDIQGYILMRLIRDSEPDAMDTELKAEILRIIPDKISGSYVKSLDSESKVIG